MSCDYSMASIKWAISSKLLHFVVINYILHSIILLNIVAVVWTTWTITAKHIPGLVIYVVIEKTTKPLMFF